ncbi:hypothetical protein BGW80DRAFT_1456384 [Lactifluus volemus]|nr:hypothetical protein BGW80DRAFT_1456384 [Lactifluus volemus]
MDDELSQYIPILTELTLNTVLQKDMSRLEGEAVNDDGTLKDADEITWLHSPSDETPLPPAKQTFGTFDGESSDDGLEKKKCCLYKKGGCDDLYVNDTDNGLSGDDGADTQGEADISELSEWDPDSSRQLSDGITVEGGNEDQESRGDESENEDDDNPEATKRYC